MCTRNQWFYSTKIPRSRYIYIYMNQEQQEAEIKMSNAWILMRRFTSTYPTDCRNIVFFQRKYASDFSKGNNHSSDIKENLQLEDADLVENGNKSNNDAYITETVATNGNRPRSPGPNPGPDPGTNKKKGPK